MRRSRGHQRHAARRARVRRRNHLAGDGDAQAPVAQESTCPRAGRADRAVLRSARLSRLPRHRRSTSARSAPPSANGRTWATRETGGAGTKAISGRSGSAISPIRASLESANVVRPMGEQIGGLTPEGRRRAGARCRARRWACPSSTRTRAGSGYSAFLSTARHPTEASLEQRLALIGGTSSCHMAVSVEAEVHPGRSGGRIARRWCPACG